MDKRHLFEQANEVSYKDTTDPFGALYEAGHFGNVADYTAASSTEDPDTGSFREGEPAKSIHNMTQAAIEAQREKMLADEEAENTKGEQEPYEYTGGSFARLSGEPNLITDDEEVPLSYDPDADIAVEYDFDDPETLGDETERYSPNLETNPDVSDPDGDNLFNDLDNPEAVMGDKEPGPGGPADTGTPSVSLSQQEVIAELIQQLTKNPTNNKELMDFLKSKLQ